MVTRANECVQYSMIMPGFVVAGFAPLRSNISACPVDPLFDWCLSFIGLSTCNPLAAAPGSVRVKPALSGA